MDLNRAVNGVENWIECW